MKLDWDCMRAVLAEAEKLPLNCLLDIQQLYDRIPAYSNDVIQYSCLKLHEAGLVVAILIDGINNMPLPKVNSIADVTYKSHEFLSKVRDDNRWRGIKKALSSVRDYSIDAINAVANGFASAAISSYLTNLEG